MGAKTGVPITRSLDKIIIDILFVGLWAPPKGQNTNISFPDMSRGHIIATFLSR